MTISNNKPWLTIIGISASGYEDLSQLAKTAISNAALLIGSKRHFPLIPKDACPKATIEQWSSPMLPRLKALNQQKPEGTVVIATGDPLCWGIAEHFSKNLDLSEMQVIPAPSIITIVSAKMHWPTATTECLSLCSQPIETISKMVSPGKNIIILSATSEHPAKIANLLKAQNYGPSKITILENIGTDQEKISQTTAQKFSNQFSEQQSIAPLNCLAITLIPAQDALILSNNPGLPDDAFTHDGQLTKQNIRAITLAHLRPATGELLWDIGAGNGSISIEWIRAADQTKAIGFEKNSSRAANAKRNAQKLGVPEYEVIEGDAPACLKDLRSPDAIFIGGGITTPNLLDTALGALKPSGRLVANTVTIEGETCLIAAHAKHGGNLSRISVERIEPIGKFKSWRPARPITQWVFHKSTTDEIS